MCRLSLYGKLTLIFQSQTYLDSKIGICGEVVSVRRLSSLRPTSLRALTFRSRLIEISSASCPSSKCIVCTLRGFVVLLALLPAELDGLFSFRCCSPFVTLGGPLRRRITLVTQLGYPWHLFPSRYVNNYYQLVVRIVVEWWVRRIVGIRYHYDCYFIINRLLIVPQSWQSRKCIRCDMLHSRSVYNIELDFLYPQPPSSDSSRCGLHTHQPLQVIMIGALVRILCPRDTVTVGASPHTDEAFLFVRTDFSLRISQDSTEVTYGYYRSVCLFLLSDSSQFYVTRIRIDK